MLAAATEDALEALTGALEAASGRQTPTLASATVAVDAIDPSALVFASRLASDRWFCWEQPDRDGFALAALGSLHEVVSRGAERFDDVARDCSRLLRDAELVEPLGLPAGAGPLWSGGFSFAPQGGRTPPWSSLPPALMVMPELSVLRATDGAYLTVNAIVDGEGSVEAAVERARRRLAALRVEPLGPLDPVPGSDAEISAPRGARHFEQLVADAKRRIHAGELEKAVLAREVVVTRSRAHDPAAVFGALRELFPSCFCFCCGTPEAAFLGASPELLIRRRGAVAATVALAGSARRSADPSVDDHLGQQLLASAKDREEHRIVVRRIERALRPHSVWVQADDGPSLARIVNVQHLATPIRAQLADSRSAIALAGDLHPTPAVGGEPEAAALAAIDEMEDLDRGWYAGPVGWMDATEDGEFCVALRSALLRDREAHLYAGAGVVADSEPAAELAETELKLDALLPLLSS